MCETIGRSIVTLLERLVAKLLITYLSNNDLLSSLQSAYLPLLHLTQMALISDRQRRVGGTCTTYLSAAFDTVEHDILIRRLSQPYGITGVALDWFRIRALQLTSINIDNSAIWQNRYSDRSCSSCTPLISLERHHLLPHLYADDCRPTDTTR